MNKAAYLMPILAGIFFGSVGIFVRTLSSWGMDNPTVLFSRCSLAVIMLGIYIFIKDKSLFYVKKENVVWILCCGIASMLITNLCFYVSSTKLSLALAAVLLSIAPIYTLIASRLVFGNKITSRKFACAIMSIVGCILVSGVVDTQISLPISGVFAGIISGVSYGMYSIFSKKAMDGGQRGMTINFYCMLLITITMAPFVDYQVIGDYVTAQPVSHIMFLIANSLCIAVLPYLLITYSLKYITPGTVTILASSEPVAAMIFGAIIYGEIPTILSVAGMIITVIALGLLCTEGRKKKRQLRG